MVLNGIDCIDRYDHLFKGKKVALLTSVTGLDRNLKSTISILHKRYGLVALFGPEHGVRGDGAAGEDVGDYIDEETGVQVYSLYKNASKHLTKEQMGLFDVLVYDIQDVGTRFYTFISTLCYVIEDLAAYGKELVILDRINPLDGVTVEGSLLDDDYRSFVGAYNLPVRYGLTCGELATMINAENNYGCNITVVKCEGWERKMQFPDTGLLYVMPSSGLPSFNSMLVYPGTCFIEGTNVSEGRGTTTPFEMLGAPFINATEFAEAMNEKKLPGVIFRPVYFTPTTSKHEGELCKGIQLHITDRHSYKSVVTGFEILYELMGRYKTDFEYLPAYREGGRPFIDLLFGNRFVWKIPPKEALFERFEKDSKEFVRRKQEFHLYK
ncbi:MAG: DUF1343 domain-containing protein [Lachnospiraceae bacterium]|nr:DUF1343 domain-containing protein [Lachnospiraceae bacterium]